jgi:hypothetical protein
MSRFGDSGDIWDSQAEGYFQQRSDVAPCHWRNVTMELARLAKNVAAGARAKRRMVRAGVNMRGRKLWTDDERKILAKYYPDYEQIQRRLPDRTHAALILAAKYLGIQKKVKHWTAADISRLRRLYTSAAPISEILAAFPWSCLVNIRCMANKRGFYRPRRPYKPTGIPAIDEIRRRCFEIGWSMADLDKEARTKTYFQHARWHNRKSTNHREIGRAIEALDGIVMPKWN